MHDLSRLTGGPIKGLLATIEKYQRGFGERQGAYRLVLYFGDIPASRVEASTQSERESRRMGAVGSSI
jgi:hypothetical protein